MNIADFVNELGRTCQRRGWLNAARVAYSFVTLLAPSRPDPWFNRGLIAKFERRWRDSLRCNSRAAELDPNNPPVWWNLGIAATALGDWIAAREAWRRYGIDVPSGEGPIDMNLGTVPIRLAPKSSPEVVWCRRIDPARAIVLSVPMPESERGCGDLVLHDGEPKGKRQHQGREVSVFDELQLLAPGTLNTYAVRVVAPTAEDLESLEAAAEARGLRAEDWSSVVWLCQQCSEGTCREHPRPEAVEWKPERLVGIASRSEAAARELGSAWAEAGSGRLVNSIECVLRRPM